MKMGEARTSATSKYTPTLVGMLVAVAAIMAGMISGMTPMDGGEPFKLELSTVAWAEEALKHDVFWADGYARDEDFSPPTSCAEWADIEWTEQDSHECFLVRDRLQTY